MIDVTHSRCKKCTTQPTYNFEGEKKPIYCKEHKENGMINVLETRKCLKCNKYPLYNFESETKGIYCVEHKEKNMIDVVNLKCKESNCNKQPNYNLLGSKKGMYCENHKEDNMIDVVNIKCKTNNCDKYPSYNLLGKTERLYCKKHKKKGMIDIVNINKKCIECNITRSNPKYRSHCIRCFLYKFPDEPVSKLFKLKENHMTDFIKKNFPSEDVIFDKTVGGCSRRRPDAFIDKLTHVIIIECDENQHSGKDYTNCDTKRTMELFQDFNNRPMVFIRFNPDAYINKDKKVDSCFNTHKRFDVPIKNAKELSSRLSKLQETMNKWLSIIPEREITYEYLFYDIN